MRSELSSRANLCGIVRRVVRGAKREPHLELFVECRLILERAADLLQPALIGVSDVDPAFQLLQGLLDRCKPLLNKCVW